MTNDDPRAVKPTKRRSSRKTTAKPAAIDAEQAPIWALSPPSGASPPPPTITRPQLLPFEDLNWRDFERLCLRLAATEGAAEHWQVYGTAGQRQSGIDVYVRRRGVSGYTVWQAKRHRRFGATDVERAVRIFLRGDWADRADRFVLAVTTSLDETQVAEAIERCAAALAARGITFVALGAARLSEMLKDHPALVDDFFDRAWTERFCGRAAASSLGQRLSRGAYADLRGELLRLYEAHFAAVDPGILRPSRNIETPTRVPSLKRRYVAPHFTAPAMQPVERLPWDEPDEGEQEGGEHREARRRRVDAHAPRPVRVTLADWSSGVQRAIVFGSPGAGKSTLVRNLALDILADVPSIEGPGRRWPELIPVVISFSFWTQAMERSGASPIPSVPMIAKAWFQALGEATLAERIGQAFDDGRVLLLVDGIDEWSDEAAAGTALTLLHTFAVSRDVPTVVTSRPHGARVLNSLDASWSRNTIAPLDETQQRAFATAWFGWLAEIEPAGAADPEALAADFVNGLARSPEVAELAGVPLLLGGLIAIVRDNAVLPRSRFEAYTTLATRLLELQPDMRSRAALTPARSLTLDAPMRRQTLAALAFRMQSLDHATGLTSMTTRDALAFCSSILSAQLELDARDARLAAQELLAVGTESVGILTEHAPGEIGFFHRAFQEILAAEHLASLTIEEQRHRFSLSACDARWSDVLLFTAQFARRPSEIDALAGAIEAATIDPNADAIQRDLVLAEIAFGRVSRSPALTRRLVTRFLDEIELGVGVAPRDRLIALAVSGLSYAQTEVLVRPRLDSWFPGMHRWNLDHVVQAMGTWCDEGVDAALLRSLQAQERSSRNAAADAIAKRKGGDTVVLAELLSMLDRAPSVEMAAALVRCLASGWADDREVAGLVDRGVGAASWMMALECIVARMAADRAGAADRSRLAELITSGEWDVLDAIPDALALDRSDDPEIRQALLERLSGSNFDADRAVIPLLKVANGRQDVADAIVAWLEKERFFTPEAGRALAVAFPGNVAIANAMAGPADRHNRAYRLAHAAALIPSIQIRDELMELVRDRDEQASWAIRALQRHWPGNPMVRECLSSTFEWPIHKQVRVAESIAEHLGPRGGVESHLASLFDAALESGGRTLGPVMNALVSSGSLDSLDLLPRLLMAIDDIALPEDEGEELTIAAIQAGPADGRVHDLAIRRLRLPGDFAVVAASFLDHVPAVRREILRICAPLPVDLRLSIADALGDLAVRNPVALELLERGRLDVDHAVASECEVRHAAALRARGGLDDATIHRLERTLQAKGDDLESKRLTALAALAAAGRFDVLARGAASKDTLAVTLDAWRLRLGAAAWSSITSNWERINKLASDGTTWLRIDDVTTVSGLAGAMRSSPALSHSVKAAAERLLATDTPPLTALEVLASEPARREEVLAGALKLLAGGPTWSAVQQALGAAALIVRRFSRSDEARTAVEAALSGRYPDGAVAALCDAWPTSPALEAYFRGLRPGSPPASGLWLPSQLKLLATMSDVDFVASALERLADEFDEDAWEAPHLWLPTIHRRIAADDGVFQGLWDRLEDVSISPSTKVSFAALLAGARGVDERLASWSRAVNCTVQGLPETGMDLTIGRVVMIRRRLHDLIRGDVGGIGGDQRASMG